VARVGWTKLVWEYSTPALFAAYKSALEPICCFQNRVQFLRER